MEPMAGEAEGQGPGSVEIGRTGTKVRGEILQLFAVFVRKAVEGAEGICQPEGNRHYRRYPDLCGDGQRGLLGRTEAVSVREQREAAGSSGMPAGCLFR